MLYDESGRGNAFITKLDSDGEVDWAQNIGGINGESISDIAVNNKKIYMAGAFFKEATFGDKTFITQNSDGDKFLVKLEEAKLEEVKEKPEITLSVDSNSIAEDNNNQITYTFTRKGDINTALTVDFTVTGSATFNEDYSLTGAEEFDGSKGKVTFKAEEATASVILNITDDTTVEQDETVAFSIAVGSDYTVSTTDVAVNTITITSDDKEIIVDETPDIPIDDKDEENEDIPIDDNDSEKPDIPIGGDNKDDDEGELSFTSNGKSTFKFKSKIKGGKSSIKFSFKSKSINEIKEIGFVTVDDDEGTIDGISPDAEGYIEAALKRAQTIFSVLGNAPQGFDSTSLEKIIEFSSDKSFRFLSVKNGTLEGVKKGKIKSSQVTFSSEVSELEKNDFDLDFAGVKIKMKLDGEVKKAIGSGLQETIEVVDLREVTVKQKATFTVYREAEYDNVIGFYQVANTEGGIDTDGDGTADILVGDAGYAQAAVQNRIASINLKVENQSKTTIDGEFEAGSIFVPFLIVNGTVDAFDEVFFPYIDANSDGADHIMMLSENTFAFEDLTGGGDRDYNDIMVNIKFDSVST